MKRSPLSSNALYLFLLSIVSVILASPALAVPRLALSALSPSSAAAGSNSFTLSLSGSGFNGKCVVLWNGQVLPTTVLSGSSATAAVPAADLASTGTNAVTVQNSRTGLTSNSLAFTVTAMTVTVSVSPQTASLLAGASQQFTASVTGSSNTGVTWTASAGSITSSGLYQAPATAGNYTVKATSVADPTKSATATVTVSVVAVSVSPSAVSLAAGGSQQFTATVTGATNTGVTWTTSGGAINATGMYVAPSTAGTYAVQATSVADPTKSAAATVTVTSNTSGTPVSVSVSPVSPSLLTGGTQQFTATVSGTTNTGVTWKASGGVITTAGLYTAPSTGGSYTVTATSVADTTKSASASVTVSAPVPHSVQLSWAASPSAGVVGYDIYRSTTSGSGYTLLNSQPDALLSYSDSTVQSGKTYYYVVTAVTSAGMQSSDSTQVTAVIPSP